MRAVLQRVQEAAVTVEGRVAGEIGPGLLVLLGVGREDADRGAETAAKLARKIARLRIFEDDEGRMNRSVLETGGAVLAVSQFTLYGDARKGNRPSFIEAARPETARPIYERFCEALEAEGLAVGRGVFGAHMDVRLWNDGPVTIVLEMQPA